MTTLSVVQVRAARMLGQGRLKQKQVADIIGVNAGTLSGWTKIPEFRRIVTAHAERHADLVSGMLLEGELEAVATLREALTAETEKGNPDWKARLTSADSLLDRRGDRGKAVQTMTANPVGTTGSLTDALRAAMRDPAVRAWVETQPQFMKALPAEIVVEEAQVDVG